MRAPVLMLILIFLITLSGCSTKKSLPIEELPSNDNELHPKEVSPSSFEIEQIMKLASKGMVIDSPFNVFESSIQQVKSSWGEPEQIDEVAGGSYATYKERNTVFGFNPEGEIYDLRSYNENLRELTMEKVEHELGQPKDMRKNNQESIYVYELQNNTELKFIISSNTKRVDHISIYNPARIKTQQYVLDIKGNSNQLTDKAWRSMQNWRVQIKKFTTEHNNVYLNGPNKKMVALTFDDGPDETITPAIIDVLNDYNVKGNFFFLGSNVKLHPEVVKKAYESGHLVLSHSFNHVELTRLGKGEVEKEIKGAGEEIQSVIGKMPAILRTPYGDTNDQVVNVSKEQGYSIVLWSIDTLDWSQKDATNIVKNVVGNVRNGDIILMHSDSDKMETEKALPLIIEALEKMNYEIVDLETLLNIKAYQ
ncbi:polysaccharide deacetylase family protein [Lederbergia wuyishanensis]|uniref:Peptidoglycan/xylan/chitin deacetylase (PgdA/CDA1 family) n=1 Tax=Lederbergia wuyishanensis TaxID=1347903 RepID=A0ABU0D6L6_9BACI|nr:polysaccharide deacetylase family protein [Lederbergia wuyishanensis]MCJ8008549.1 DUF4309 domain-containing protein [Lederbergia wuyishanensis]MDQ0344037.1 peptidoglycan/xylan/chitin deacetylase (PgdA/CDA1 family) [Lederbergia wuyishanensis]